MNTVANNIANAGTTGYRGETTLFEPVMQDAGEPRGVAFVQDVGLYRDVSPGPITRTENPLDVSVDGEGYLTFQAPGGERYGRGGHLELDADGRVVDARGDPLLDEGGKPVVVPDGEGPVAIGRDGTVAGRAGPIARLQLVTFANEQALRGEGGGLFRSAAPPRPASGRLVQGALEGSNVQPVLEMTRMLETQRAFEGVQKLIEAQDELDRRAIERMISVAG